MEERDIRVLISQYRRAMKIDNPNLIPIMDEADVRVWYFLVVNPPPPFTSGEFIFKLVAPDNFPTEPPQFSVLTPNGVYDTTGRICLSIGEFHAHAPAGADGSMGWRASLGMPGFANEAYNGLIHHDTLEGIRIIKTTHAEKRRLAEASRGYNLQHHADLVSRFQHIMSIKPSLEAVRACKMRQATTQAVKIDYAEAVLEDLSPLLAEAFSDCDIPDLSESLLYLTTIPDLPIKNLVAMGFPASGRVVMVRIADVLRETLNEYDPTLKKALGLALHARICLELSREAPKSQPCDWDSRFIEGFNKLLEYVPSVSGGASKEIVPEALKSILTNPDIFTQRVHNDFCTFLRADDIDEKARLGVVFAASISQKP